MRWRCRDGSRVFVDYRAQFSGEKHPTAAGGGFQQAKRGRKAQRDAPSARAAEAAHAEGSCVGHWMTTHVQGRRRKVGTLRHCIGSACSVLETCLKTSRFLTPAHCFSDVLDTASCELSQHVRGSAMAEGKHCGR